MWRACARVPMYACALLVLPRIGLHSDCVYLYAMRAFSPHPKTEMQRIQSHTTPFLIANRHLFTSDRQIALVSSAGIPLRQRSPHIDIVHLYKARGIENRHSAPCWHWSQNLGYWMSMPKLNAPAEIHWRRSNMNTQDPILMKSVEVLKDCRSLNAAAEMNCPMPRSVEKVPIRNEKRCNTDFLTSCDSICPAHWLGCRVSNAHGYWIPRSRAISIRSKWRAPE